MSRLYAPPDQMLGELATREVGSPLSAHLTARTHAAVTPLRLQSLQFGLLLGTVADEADSIKTGAGTRDLVARRSGE